MTERPALHVTWVNQFAVPPDQAGGTRHHEMAAELLRRGVDCRLVASDLSLGTRSYTRRRHWWSPKAIAEDVEGVPFVWLAAGTYADNDWRRGASMMVFSAAVLLHLVRVPVPRGRAVFIGSSPQLFAAAATWVAARIRRVPFVFEVRDLWPESYSGITGRSDGIEVRVLRRVADLLYRRADAIVLLAAPNREHVVARGAHPERVSVIPNGVDLADEVEASSGLDVGTPGCRTLVYAGAHGPANGLDVVLDACQLLKELGREDVRVAFVGDGPSKVALVARADELGLRNVSFHPPVPKREVSSVLRTADAGLMVLADVDVFSSGVSPNKLFDYLAAGLPVVTNVPGVVAGVVEEAGAGIVVTPGDAAALAKGMLDLVSTPEAALASMRRGRRYIAEHHDRRRLADQLKHVLEQVASR